VDRACGNGLDGSSQDKLAVDDETTGRVSLILLLMIEHAARRLDDWQRRGWLRSPGGMVVVGGVVLTLTRRESQVKSKVGILEDSSDSLASPPERTCTRGPDPCQTVG